jgi:hypothetical protein
MTVDRASGGILVRNSGRNAKITEAIRHRGNDLP